MIKNDREYEGQEVEAIAEKEKHLYIVDEVRELNLVISRLNKLINNIIGQKANLDDKTEFSMPVSLEDTLNDLPYIIREKRITMVNLIEDISNMLFIKEKS